MAITAQDDAPIERLIFRIYKIWDLPLMINQKWLNGVAVIATAAQIAQLQAEFMY